MADSDSPPPERRQRKSVAFAEGETLIDNNGDSSTQANGTGDKHSAESHSLEPNGDGAIDDATASFDDLALAKKKKKSKKKDAEKLAADDAGDAAPAATAEDELDLGALKKKKKKAKAAKAEDAEDFDAKLAQAGGVEKDAAADGAEVEGAEEASTEDAGDMEEGTGVWAHDSSQPINYPLLLSRFFKLLNTHNPDLMSSGGKSYKIPPPQCLREGNKKTIFANIAEICRRMKRSDEHVTQFLFAELGTTGSVDGSRRLVIKGKFLQKQIENVLRRYIVEYVSCKTCRSPDTELTRGENRLLFIECNSCASRRSVQSIKTGFTAQVGKRRRQQG